MHYYYSVPLGWERDADGFQGHIFVSADESSVVLSNNCTSTGILAGGRPIFRTAFVAFAALLSLVTAGPPSEMKSLSRLPKVSSSLTSRSSLLQPHATAPTTKLRHHHHSTTELAKEIAITIATAAAEYATPTSRGSKGYNYLDFPIPSNANSPTRTVIVASQGVLRYVPFDLDDSVGGTVRFVWGAGPHTVTKSSALNHANPSARPSSNPQNKNFVFN